MVALSVPRQPFLSRVRLRSSPRETLRDGATLRLTVTSLKRGRAILSNSDLQISARNNAGLLRGETVLVTVRRSSKGLRLEILHRGPIQPRHATEDADLYLRFARSHGIAPSETGRSIFEALVASSRALSPQLYKAVRSRLSGSERHSTVRGEVELVDRGIATDRGGSNGIDALRSWLSGDGSGTEQRDDHRDRSSGGRSDRSGAGVPEHEAEYMLKAFLHRQTSEPSHPLQLFNAILPRSGAIHWVVAPLRCFYNTQSVEGVLKLGIDVATRTTRTAILSIERPNGRWWFEWSVGTTLALERFGCEGEQPRLPERLLAMLGGTRHTMIMSRSDGFEIDPPGVIDGRIDRYG